MTPAASIFGGARGWRRPSYALLACALAASAPAVWLLTADGFAAPAVGDVVFAAIPVYPHAAAVVCSTRNTEGGRVATVVSSAFAVAVAFVAITAYGLGLLFIVQALASLAVSSRRARA